LSLSPKRNSQPGPKNATTKIDPSGIELASRIFSLNVVCGRGEDFSLELSDRVFLSHRLMISGPRIRLMPIDDVELEIAADCDRHDGGF